MPIRHWNAVISDNPHNNQIHFILHWNQVKLDPPHWDEANLDHPHKKKVNLHLTLKTSHFRPTFKNQVNFYHPHNTRINFNPTLKSSPFDPPYRNQVHLDHPHKNDVIFHAYPASNVIFGQHKSNKSFLAPTQPNQFHPCTEIKSSSILHIKIKSISTTITKPSQFPCSH